MDSSDLHRRLYRWLIAFFGVCILFVMFAWLVGLRFQSSPWDFHMSRMHAGKQKGSMRLAENVWLYRTRSAIGLHLRDGTPIVQGVIKRIGYDKDVPDTLIVAYSKAPFTQTERFFGRPEYTMAQINLVTAGVTPIEDSMGLKDQCMQPAEVFFPYDAAQDVP